MNASAVKLFDFEHFVHKMDRELLPKVHRHSKVTLGKRPAACFWSTCVTLKALKFNRPPSTFIWSFCFSPSQFRWGWGWVLGLGELLFLTQALNLICIWIRQCRRFPQSKGKSYNFFKLCHMRLIHHVCNSIQPIPVCWLWRLIWTFEWTWTRLPTPNPAKVPFELCSYWDLIFGQ